MLVRAQIITCNICMPVAMTYLPFVTLFGWLLIVVGTALYCAGIAAAVIRVRSQYSRAMPGMGSISRGTAFAVALKLWPFLFTALVGLALVLATR